MKELIERYRKLYAGVIYDAMAFDLKHQEPFVMDRAVRHLAGPTEPTVGPAFTCVGVRNHHDDIAVDVDTRRLEVFGAIPHGSIVVMRTHHDCEVAHFGDISALIAKTAGAVGVVIDGYTRDIGRIDHLGLPLFAKGVQPIDAYGWWSLVRHSESIELSASGGANLTVEPGDLIFADRDGVLVIPQDLAADVLEAAEDRAKGEDKIREAILAGEKPMDIYRRLGRW